MSSVCVQSVSFGQLMSPKSGAIYEIPNSDPLVAPAPGSTANTPDQIHVTLGGVSPKFAFLAACSHAATAASHHTRAAWPVQEVHVLQEVGCGTLKALLRHW